MKKILRITLLVICLVIIIGFLGFKIYTGKIGNKVKYDNSHFGITTYHSNMDKDNDGVDDQTDILNNVRSYIATKPKYDSKYYAGGYPDDGYGVCTDVVAFGLLGAGYDLRELVNEDIKNNPEKYNIKVRDKNIDYRRVRNLLTYLEGNSINLSTDIKNINEWQGGDIVVFSTHIGIVSDKRNKKGIPYVIHHERPYQEEYEEDILGSRKNDIKGHFRVS